MKKILFALLLAVSAQAALAQDGKLDKVFVLGEQEAAYEKLVEAYAQPLVQASDSDLKKAFEHWLNMMQAMDTYADKIKFNLKGIKVWFHVFWAPDGSIDHIGYILRPDSRNVPLPDMSAFLSSFARQYTLPLKSSRPFSHYTGATFPTFTESYSN